MAKAITDEVALSIARGLVKSTEEWTSEHHARFIWKWFRLQGFKPEVRDKEGKLVEKPTEEQVKESVKSVGRQWDAMHNNARLAYASNQAKGLSEAKVCAAPRSAEKVAAEYD